MNDPTVGKGLHHFARFRSLTRITAHDGTQFQHVECECGNRQLHGVDEWQPYMNRYCAGCHHRHAHANSDAARRLRAQEAGQ